MNIVRHFSITSPSLPGDGGKQKAKDREVLFTLSLVDYVFELRVPRLQMTASSGFGLGSREKEKEVRAYVEERGGDGDKDKDGEKKELRREIKKWWEGVADHMDTLVGATMFFVDLGGLLICFLWDGRR
jgi:1-phosphatidylinositol-3-phosphate 5-kinase